MLILAFETSAKAASVALTENGKLLGEGYQNTGLTHSQTLMVMAEDVLKQCGKTAADVEAVAVAAGPGSFTGVRIGVAAAWGKEIPCYCVSTLEAMAENLGAFDGYVCPCMDARRSQVYNALFLAEKGKLSRVTDDRAIALTDLKTDLEHIDGPIYLVGDGAVLCHNTLKEEVPNLVLPAEHRLHQRAVGVAVLAQKMADAGIAPSGGELNPNYLRLSQAEREKLEKENKR